jgi:hypothetical protein
MELLDDKHWEMVLEAFHFIKVWNRSSGIHKVEHEGQTITVPDHDGGRRK